MDDNMHRENGRHKSDHYKGNHAQWMMSQHQMKDHSTFKIMAAMAERDSAIQQRDIALTEKKAAIAERDMAILERDAAIAERNNAIVERDSVIGALRYARENANLNGNPMFIQGFAAPRAMSKQSNPNQHHTSHVTQSPLLFDPPYACNAREMHVNEASPISTMPENGAKPRRSKHPRKDNKVQSVPLKKPAKTSRKNKKTAEDLNKQLATVKSPWRTQEVFSNSGSEDLNKVDEEWRGRELGLNLVTFDKMTMPVPGCSCTGILRQCYKWGSGGWQSSCCTTTISMYPLPVMPNKRHARVGGRKMSGSAFAKLLSRMAREGHDLSTPLDLKDHWAKHGTNRYITVK